MRIALAAILLLAACDSSASAPEAPPIKVTGAVDYQAQLEGLSDVNRRLALRRAIQDAGNPCKRIESDAHQGAYKALDQWIARCSDSGDWVVFLAATGDIQVRSCKDAETLGLPRCDAARLDG